MTPNEEALVFKLVHHQISKDEFLNQMGDSDGSAVGLRLLNDAISRRDADGDFEYSFIVCWIFGISAVPLDTLIQLAYADWHGRHEDVTSALAGIKSPRSVDALLYLASEPDGFGGVDEFHALGSRATYALRDIPGDDAAEALQVIARTGPEKLVKLAKKFLTER